MWDGAPIRMLCAFVVACVTVVCALGCSGDDAPAQTPTSAIPTEESEPTEAPVPPEPTAVIDVAVTPGAGGGPVVGPVLAYQTITGDERLVIYDLGAGRVLWSTRARIEGFTGVAGVALAGKDVIVATGKKVRVYSHDGTSGAVLFTTGADEYVIDIAASKDGSKLAITLEGPSEPFGTPTASGQVYRWRGAVVFIDLTTRTQIRRFESNQPEFAEAKGYFYEVMWREDGQGVVLNFGTSSERPGGAATVYVDGRVVLHDLEAFAYVSPDGRLAVDGEGTVGCLALAGRRFGVVDLDQGAETAAVEEPGYMYSGQDWSPRSDEFLLLRRTYDESQICSIRNLPTEAFTLSASTGELRRVSDLEALYRRWYGDELLWMDCGPVTGFVPVRRSYVGKPYGICAGDYSEDGTLRYQQLEIARGRGFLIYGVSQ